MERNMYNENSFEQNLKQKADAYRMYPSDNVWDSIHQKLHNRNTTLNRTITFLFLLVFTGTSLVISNRQPVTYPLSVNTIETPKNDVPVSEETTVRVERKKRNQAQPSFRNRIYVKDLASVPQVPSSVPDALRAVTPASSVPEEPVIAGLQERVSVNSSLLPAATAPHSAEDRFLVAPVGTTTPQPESELQPMNQTDADINFEVAVPVHIKTKPKRELQFYVAPSASYRVLYVDNKLNIGNLRLDPESVVSHEVATGWEAGIALLSPVSNRLRFKSGIQANYTRYRVKASQSGPEITTVTLTSFTRIQRLTTLRNSEGALPRNLENKTLQFSVPVGIEYRLLGNNKLSFNLAAALQPTYTLSATGYLVTTDYRNYIKAPDLLRQFNVNSGLESFVRFKTGSVDIQAGPQLRYQLFSNSKGKYPIQEHLIDYGFKVGIIKTLK